MTMHATLKVLSLTALVALAGCVVMPTGPSQMALPGTGKSFDQFRNDDGGCRQYAFEQIGGQTATQAQSSSAVQSAAVGTVVGALAGAAIGGSSGAAAGAGVGLLGGSVVGASTGNVSGYEAQYRYDMAYVQCMYARGHKVPTNGRFTSTGQHTYSAPPPPARSAPPPPPPGSPPPPPPGVSW